MILSVSRRTDIPAFYSDWFYNRIREGYACVRNPMNRHQVSKIRLSPDVIDCIVFWSKNPAPMLPRLGELADYMYYFQFTVTPYGKIGFIDEKGDVAVEAKHEFVSAMSPDGYFVTKIRRDFDEIYSEVYARGLIDVMIYDRNGNAATENMGGMYNAGNSATDGYAPLDFYAGAKYQCRQ